MGKHRKFFERLMSGSADANLAFDDVCQLLLILGFNLRVRGDHYIFTKDHVEEILNLQPRGVQAKSYQIKQIRNVLRLYHIDIKDNE